MSETQWKLRDNVELDADKVARIACALKSLSIYTTLACSEDEHPEELEKLVQDGLDAINEIFDV